MTIGPQLKKIYWSLVVVFFLFSMAITMAGYLFYENQKKNLRQEKWDELGAISDLKVRQIVNWRKERIEDGWNTERRSNILFHPSKRRREDRTEVEPFVRKWFSEGVESRSL